MSPGDAPVGIPVLATRPRLPGSTPFPTTYYLTCPSGGGRDVPAGGLGIMAEMTQQLADDPLAEHYRQA